MLKPVTTLVDFARLVPELSRIHSEFASRWDDSSDESDFFAELVSKFSGALVYADTDEGGRLIYFIFLVINDKECMFRVLHVDYSARDLTKKLLDSVKTELLARGVERCYFSSTRVTRSYDRWVKKFGAQPCEIIYKLKLLP